MINTFLFISGLFLITFLLGRLIEKARVPWIFAALIVGAVLAINNPFSSITSSDTFSFLANLGMYFLLFIIGFEIDLKKLKKQKGFIFKSAFFIIFLEAILGSLVIHFAFGYGWLISCLVALSFATVGEAILVPILQEFRITNTKLGQSLIGIGTIDDIIEIFTLIVAVALIGTSAPESVGSVGHFNIWTIMGSLFMIFLLTFIFMKFRNKGKKFHFFHMESMFIFVLFVLFLFLGIGEFSEATSLAALLAGISLKTFLPSNRLKLIESEVKTMCYGFFAPIFFLWVGLEMNIEYLVSFPLLILLVVGVSKTAKIFGSYIAGRKYLGVRKSILLGIGLSVRFSTSIIVITILFKNGLIQSDIFSVLIASSIVFKFIVPLLFSTLASKWKIGYQKSQNKTSGNRIKK